MTAITANIIYDQSTTPSGQLKIVDFSTGVDHPNSATLYTYTPGVSSGKTIRVISCRLIGGTAVKATVSTTNVISIGDEFGEGANAGDIGIRAQRGTLVYTETN